MTFAPICIFAYNRPLHLSRLLQRLESCREYRESPLYLFIDGPRTDRPADSHAVGETRQVACGISHPNFQLIIADANKGLARSIREGVTLATRTHGSAIVLEDDLLVESSCLTFFNSALQKFETSRRVYQVSGFSFPTGIASKESYFLPFISTWGWATWKDRWEECSWDAPDAPELLGQHPALRTRFNLDDSYDYSRMLMLQLEKKIDSWGILWNWHVFRQDGIVLYPPVSMIENDGFDSGTHGRRDISRHLDRTGAQGTPSLPTRIAVDLERYAKVTSHLRRMNRSRGVDYLHSASRRVIGKFHQWTRGQ